MAFKIEDRKLPRWKAWLMALVGLGAATALSGCSQAAQPPVMYVVDPSRSGTTDAWPLSAERLPNIGADLQHCADHAAQSQRAAWGETFRMLRLEQDGTLQVARLNAYVGQQYVATVQDATGTWYGRGATRKVRVHCMADARGQVVYSFVRPE